MTITEIKQQEKNKKKLSIFMDGEYFDSILEEVFRKSHLKVGSEITAEQWAQLKMENETRWAFDRGLFYLERRDRSEKEMRDYLSRKGIDEEALSSAIGQLKAYGYIDDQRFAKAVVSDHIRIKRNGRKAIGYTLRRYGIHEDIIEEALSSYDGEIEQENAIACARSLLKKYSRVEDEYKKKQKMASALARRGYDWEIIKQAIAHVLGLEEEV